MAEIAKIPEKLYVTVQYRPDAKNDDGLLGFASPYTKDAAFQKRKKTQDDWAYSSGIKVEIDEDESITVTGKGQGLWAKTPWDAGMLFTANCYPRIIPNDLVDGFQIAKSVRRYGWGGGGNVKWRITDPRGFDLEISSENFAKIIDCSTIINGVIQGKCCWGRTGAQNVLLPEHSEPYKQSKNFVKAIVQATKIKDIQPGTRIKVHHQHYKDQWLIYIGELYLIGNDVNYRGPRSTYSYNTGKVSIGTKQRKVYFFKMVETRFKVEYLTIGEPKVIEIGGKEENFSLDEHIKTINEVIEEGEYPASYRFMDTIFVSPTKINLDDVKVSFEPTELRTNGRNTWAFIKFEDKLMKVFCNNRGQEFLAEVKFEGKALNVPVDPKNYGRLDPSVRRFSIIQAPKDKFLKMVAHYNGQTYRIRETSSSFYNCW